MGHEPDEFFTQDVAACRRFFDDVLMLPMETYAFPNGSYRASQIEELRTSGVRYPLLVDERLAFRTGTAFARVTIYGRSLAEIKFLIARFTWLTR